MNSAKDSHPPAETIRSRINAEAASECRSSSGVSDGRIECGADAVIIALDVNESTRRAYRQGCADYRGRTPGGRRYRTQAACCGSERSSSLSKLGGSVGGAGSRVERDAAEFCGAGGGGSARRPSAANAPRHSDE